METLKSSVIAMCALSAVSFMIEYLAGGTKLKDQMRFMIKLVTIIAVLLPFIKSGANMELPEITSGNAYYDENTIEIYNEELRRQTSYNVSEVLLEHIRSRNIDCSKIETYVNILEDGSITISKVTIIADDFKGAEKIVKNCLGEETEVVNGGQ